LSALVYSRLEVCAAREIKGILQKICRNGNKYSRDGNMSCRNLKGMEVVHTGILQERFRNLDGYKTWVQASK